MGGRSISGAPESEGGGDRVGDPELGWGEVGESGGGDGGKVEIELGSWD